MILLKSILFGGKKDIDPKVKPKANVNKFIHIFNHSVSLIKKYSDIKIDIAKGLLAHQITIVIV